MTMNLQLLETIALLAVLGCGLCVMFALSGIAFCLGVVAWQYGLKEAFRKNKATIKRDQQRSH